MWTPSPVLRLELTEPLPEATLPAGCRTVQALLTWNGVPCGWQAIPVVGDRLMTVGLVEHILERHFLDICSRLLRERLLEGRMPSVDALPLTESVPSGGGRHPPVSVVLCTRDRPEDVARCLRALKALQPAPHEIIVVDNAPSSRSTEQLLAGAPGIRYVKEPRPGLSWARNRAIAECRGEIVAFVDDDVVVDERWVGMLQRTLAMDPDVGAVTGLILPYELETEAQEQFEVHGGFGRGYVPKWFHHSPSAGQIPWRLAATGVLGSGANMAFRRQVFERTGLFTPNLGAGTRAQGGEDLEMLFRVIKCGFPVVYEPRAFVWHRHRYGMGELMQQMQSWGTGCLAYVAHARQLFPKESRPLRRFEYHWRYTLLRRALAQYLRPNQSPHGLRLHELRGSFAANACYKAAAQRAREIERQYGPQLVNGYPSAPRMLAAARSPRRDAVARRTLDLTTGVVPVTDVAEYGETEIVLTLHGQTLGSLNVKNAGLPISRDRLTNLLLEQKSAPEWLALFERADVGAMEAAARRHIAAHMFPRSLRRATASARGRGEVSLVVVASTSQRLRRSLPALVRAASGLDAEVLLVVRRSLALPEDLLPTGVRIVHFDRGGRSAALNAGVRAAQKRIVVCTNDRVVCDEACLRRLLGRFERNDIDIVSGGLECEGPDCGFSGVFRGSDAWIRESEAGEVGKWEFSSTWIRPVPAQTFGTTNLLGVRREVFANPEIGPFDESLGPGAPSAGGEEGYFLYRALKAGCGIVYEPAAVVRLQRVTRAALRRQFFGQGMGYAAFNLHTLVKQGDVRAATLLFWLPCLHFKRLLAALRSSADALPMDLMLAELAGHVAGPIGLAGSYGKLLYDRRRPAPAAGGKNSVWRLQWRQ